MTLAFRVAGDPAQPPLVLLHGLGNDASTWDALVPALAATHRVYAPDARGHGRSPQPGEYSFELMRDDLIAFLDAEGIERCAVIGHSMGGMVALLLAEAAPHRLTRLVLVDMMAPRKGDLDRPPLPVPDEPTPYDWAAVNAIRAQLHDPDPAWFANLGAATVPTLFIGGAHSQIPQHLIAETAAQMPDARVLTLDAGHRVHHDRPAEVLAAITGFLG